MTVVKGALAALFMLCAAPIAAEENGFTLSIQGGLAASEFTRDYAATQGPARFFTRFFTDDSGKYGSVALSYGFAPSWDARLSVSGHSFPTSLQGSFLGCCILSTWTSFDATTADLDLGFHRQFGQTAVRFGAGVATANMKADLHQNVVGFTSSLITGDVFDAQRYKGLGARLSVDLDLPVPREDDLRLILGANIATLWGDLTQDRTVIEAGGVPVSGSASAKRQMLSLGTYIGLSVPVPKGAVRAGFRYDHFHVGGTDPLDSGETGFLQQGVGAGAFFVGYDMTF